MQAFSKFGQKYLGKTKLYIGITAIFAAVGWFGVVLIGVMKGPQVLSEIQLLVNLMLQSTAACVFFLFVKKIFNAYLEQQMFSTDTLYLIKTLARLIMLFAIVIEPGFYSVLDYFSTDPEVLANLGVVSYMENINITLFAAGYALHLVSVVHKVARQLEEEQDLTI